jgi:hypothetical protein
LGGPLLKDLFTEESQRKVRLTYDKIDWTDRFARWACDAWTNFRAAPDQKNRVELWGDPEEYLDLLDSAVRQGQNAMPWKHLTERFQHAVHGDCNNPGPVSDWAKRWMIAECCGFVKSSDPQCERWQPHRLWAQALDGPTAVITFNYDLAFERLLPKHNLYIPHADATYEPDLPNLYKLHGSIDWKRTEDGHYARHKDPDFSVTTRKPNERGVATPGPSKLSHSTELKELWDMAMTAVRQAECVFFVGYRFPPTDVHARNELLKAIGENKSLDFLGIVLGPNTEGEAIKRLVRFLLSVTKARVRIYPYYCEEFFTLYVVTGDPKAIDHEIRASKTT